MPPPTGRNAHRARFADEAWRPVLLGGESLDGAMVDTVFERSLNITRGGGLLAILTESGRRSPGAMITTLSDIRGVRPGTPVEFGKHTLVIGRLELDCSLTTFFDCATEPVELINAPSAEELDAILARHARPGSFLAGGAETPFERAIAERLKETRDAFCSQLQSAALVAARRGQPDAEAMRYAVAGLVGLGFGLTPSGDDYLVGVLAALALTPGGVARAVRDLVAACVLPLASERGGRAATTAVSRHFLRAACRGEFHEDLSDSGRKLMLGEDRTDDALARVVSIGSTSGTDALFGLVDGVRTLAAVC